MGVGRVYGCTGFRDGLLPRDGLERPKFKWRGLVSHFPVSETRGHTEEGRRGRKGGS